MARVQLIMRDEDRSRYIHQARKEGLTLSAWLRAAAERLERNSRAQPFKSTVNLESFFTKCEKLNTSGSEPDWEQHLSVIDEARNRGTTST